jgi:hypothetical protein
VEYLGPYGKVEGEGVEEQGHLVLLLLGVRPVLQNNKHTIKPKSKECIHGVLRRLVVG